MEIVLGALPSLLPKLGELLKDEYNLQKDVKGRIRFLQVELDRMKAALEDVSKTPLDQLPTQDRLWAKEVREMSYDIEDVIDKFMVQVQVKCSEQSKTHGFIRKSIDKISGYLMQATFRRKISTEIKDINNRVVEVHNRRRRYDTRDLDNRVSKRLKLDPRALVRYEDVTKLVGIDEARDEIINLIESNDASKHHEKIVSIVGIGGLGKTTLANVIYEKLRAKFVCSAFVSVSQTPDMENLLKDMFYELTKNKAASIGTTHVINELREVLHKKRYFIIIDDIWKISDWKTIRYALPDDNDEYRIITTTRYLNVAEKIGGAYKMKPLSPENSKILMYGRIFGKEGNDKCIGVDGQLEMVLDRILKKCGGVPLAIVTIASLLLSKGRNKLEWHVVCKSIGAGLEENNTVEDMIKVLLLSYYDMPSHLRTCLLYFSMFPEDYLFFKDYLIRLWIAEGFIQSGKEENLFEIGESYYNELVSRSMIQPKSDYFNGPLGCCRVHDMVLDLTRRLSREENFVTMWDHVGHPSTSEKVRRLSLLTGKAGHLKASMSMEHVRSFRGCSGAVDHLPTLESFRVLRVLDLGGCDLSQGYSLKDLGNLLHLRYLGLKYSEVDELPEEIGNLRFLQTLDLTGNDIYSLPSNIVRLTHLMVLRIGMTKRVPAKGIIGSLTALEELDPLFIQDDDSTYIIEELGHLRKLRKLVIVNKTKWSHVLDKSLVESLNKLQKISNIAIRTGWYADDAKCNLDGWVIAAPQRLRKVELRCWSLTLPTWVMNPSFLSDLFYLDIAVWRLQQQDLEILGRLPALCYLRLTVNHKELGIRGRFTVGAFSFPCLDCCELQGFGGPVVFQRGAMPRLTKLELSEFPAQETREINDDFDLGLRNLSSLRIFTVWFRSRDASKEVVKEAKAAVRNAIKGHPNHLILDIIEDDESWTYEDEG